MKTLRKIIGVLSLLAFLFALSSVYSCSGDKRRTSRVHSKPEMGNSKHKNKHVWGK